MLIQIRENPRLMNYTHHKQMTSMILKSQNVYLLRYIEYYVIQN
jgi:hypothetical protein